MAKERTSHWIRSLLQDKATRVIEQVREKLPRNRERRKTAKGQIQFLKGHQERMLYGTYRKRGWFIGSGVIEAGCERVVGKRLKQSGMFWPETGAGAVLQFRSLLLSRRFDVFWTQRQNQAAARIDALALQA